MVKYEIRVKIILLLSVPVTVLTNLSEQPELLKHHTGLCFGWHIWDKSFWGSCYEDRMGLQQHLLIQGHFISSKVINHVMRAPTNQMRACLCPAGILQTPCGGLWLRPWNTTGGCKNNAKIHVSTNLYIMGAFSKARHGSVSWRWNSSLSAQYVCAYVDLLWL